MSDVTLSEYIEGDFDEGDQDWDVDELGFFIGDDKSSSVNLVSETRSFSVKTSSDVDIVFGDNSNSGTYSFSVQFK